MADGQSAPKWVRRVLAYLRNDIIMLQVTRFVKGDRGLYYS